MGTERYDVISKGDFNIKYLNCPVQVDRTQLLLDKIGNDYLCRVVLKSFSRFSQIKAAVVSLVCYDKDGQELGIVSGQKIISEEPVHFGDEFGKDTVIKIPYEGTAKVIILINSVAYVDMSVREINPMTNKPVKPVFISIDNYPEPDRDIIKEALPKQKIVKINYVYSQNDGYWTCTCGQVNSNSEVKCTGCSGLKSAMSKIFSKEYVDSVLKEREEKAKIAEEERKRKEEAEKKRIEELEEQERIRKQKLKKKIIIGTPITAFLILMIVLSVMVFAPLGKYNKAVKLMDEGKYFEAIEKFEALDGFKDSKTQIDNVYVMIMNCSYVRSGDVIYSGSYPQSLVEDTTIKEQLSSKIGQQWTKDTHDDVRYQDVSYGNNRYRGVYSSSTIYWFKYEPIKWRILSEENGEALILCDMIIDSNDYNYTKSNHASGAAANDWAESTIRTWLNDTFYNTAFSDLQKSIILEQTLTTSKFGGGTETTTDNVFLLTKEDVSNSAYGFSEAPSRQKKTTDYAQQKGAYTSKDSNYNGNGYWWLRSPYTYYSDYEYFVYYEGYVRSDYYDYHSVDHTRYGVVPALKIKL